MSEVFKLLDDLEKAADRALREAGGHVRANYHYGQFSVLRHPA